MCAGIFSIGTHAQTGQELLSEAATQAVDWPRRAADPLIHVFVYGTLRRGGEAAGLLSGCERVRAATVRGTLYRVGEYPALVLAGDDLVHGEVWRCPADLLARLDSYERVQESLFRRVGLRVGDLPCWTYVAGPALAPRLRPERRIESGVWLAST